MFLQDTLLKQIYRDRDRDRNTIVHSPSREAHNEFLKVCLIGDVTMHDGEDVLPRVLIKLTHAEHKSTEGHVYQTLVHGGCNAVIFMHMHANLLDLRRKGNIHNVHFSLEDVAKINTP